LFNSVLLLFALYYFANIIPKTHLLDLHLRALVYDGIDETFTFRGNDALFAVAEQLSVELRRPAFKMKARHDLRTRLGGAFICGGAHLSDPALIDVLTACELEFAFVTAATTIRSWKFMSVL